MARRRRMRGTQGAFAPGGTGETLANRGALPYGPAP